MAKALVVYTTRSGQTQTIAEYIAEGIRFAGAEAVLVNSAQLKDEADLDGYDAYVFGSPTYHGEMVVGMKNFLFLVAKRDVSGKVGGAFGAYGWSGEAHQRIYDTMKNVLNMDVVDGPLVLKSPALQGGMQMAQDYGKKIGKKIVGS